MNTKKLVLPLVFVTLCFMTGLLVSARTADAAHRRSGRDIVPPAAPDGRPERIHYAGEQAYDSGWRALGIRVDPIVEQFTHGLGGNPEGYLVNLTCRAYTSLTTYDCTDEGFNTNAHWYGLTNSSINVYVGSVLPDEIRVRIYKSVPVYDSGWRALGIRVDPIVEQFTHGLGGDPEDYVVNLTCRAGTSLATYDCTDEGFNTNAHWYGLTNSLINVYVGSVLPDDIRVRIYESVPVYDSDWRALGTRVDPIVEQLTHGLGGDPEDYLVNLACRAGTTLSTYDCTDEGFNTNAHWYGLTSTSINVYAGSVLPDEIRVRIWRATNVYLPFVTKD